MRVAVGHGGFRVSLAALRSGSAGLGKLNLP